MPGKTKAAYPTTSIEDNNLANGPVQRRGCTDILCLLIFILFILGMFAITGYAINKGQPELIGRGYDADGNICGYSSGYEDYPLLYWPAPVNGLLTHTVCVSACPTDPLPSVLNCKTNTQIQSCVSNSMNFDPNMINANTFLIYDTKSLAGRVCLPGAGVTFATVSQQFLDSDLLGQWISDVRTTWTIILATIGIAFFLGLIYMIFVRFCAGVMTWSAIILFIAGLGVLGWRFWDQSQRTKDVIENTENTGNGNVHNTELTEKILAGICWGVAGLTFLLVCCLYNRIRLAIGILKAAADYIKDTWSVFLVPPVFFVALIIFYTYWTITTVFLASSGEPTQIQDVPLGTFEFDKTVQRLLIYHLFALLWCNAFILAALQFVIASSVCIWYFSQGTGQAGAGSIRKSVYRLFRYHLGSIAFGSLILAIIQFIRAILAYIDRKAKQWTGSDSTGTIIKYSLKCLQCCVYCFERFIKFLNKSAWIQIAMTGKNFCAAARAGLKFAINNPLRYAVVYSVTNIFVLFGKLFIAAASTLIGFVIITKVHTYADEIYSPFIPSVIFFIFSYTVGALFLNVYGMAAETILACFLFDENLQGGRNAPALHCPSSLKQFLDKNRQI